MTSTATIRQILANLDTLPDGEAGDDLELSLLRDLRDAVTEAEAAERIAAGTAAGNLSWGDVAEQSARGWCPASPEGTEPHKVTDGRTCDECGADADDPFDPEHDDWREATEAEAAAYHSGHWTPGLAFREGAEGVECREA